MKKVICLFLLCAMIYGTFSCGETGTPTDTTSASEDTTAEVTIIDMSGEIELPEDLRFDGETFTIAVYKNSSANNLMLSDEESGDTLNDATYKRQIRTEERFGINLEQVVYEDGAMSGSYRASVMASDNTFDIATVRCTDALTFWQDGLLTPASDLPYINLDKSYWNRSFNDSLTLNNEQYVAIGDMMTSTFDLTYVLLFNKKLMTDYSLGNIYELVNDGNWTFEQMSTMMKAVTADLNGDTKMDENDMYGYLAHPKMVLPNFWISAGELAVKKDANDLPYLAMGEERFNNVIESVFSMMYDDNNYLLTTDNATDVPQSAVNIFTNDHSLFMDCSFFFIQNLRNMETDFGIVPYPKYDESQSRYYSRVSYYNAPVIPITNSRLELTGAVLEYLNYVSSQTVIPAYYDIVLKSKTSRDNESQEMLDLIFESRVVDIGDTTMCDKIRDGFVYTMFKNDDRDLTSKLPTAETAIEKFLSKLSLD